jgi:hypothetical protein
MHNFAHGFMPFLQQSQHVLGTMPHMRKGAVEFASIGYTSKRRVMTKKLSINNAFTSH